MPQQSQLTSIQSDEYITKNPAQMGRWIFSFASGITPLTGVVVEPGAPVMWDWGFVVNNVLGIGTVTIRVGLTGFGRGIEFMVH